MWFVFKMCVHFQNGKGSVSVVFPFSEKKRNCKQNLHIHKKIYIKLLNLFQLSRIYDLLYPTLVLTVDTVDLLSVSEFSVMRMLLTVMS